IAAGISTSECSPPLVIMVVMTISFSAPDEIPFSIPSSKFGEQKSLKTKSTSKPVALCRSKVNFWEPAQKGSFSAVRGQEQIFSFSWLYLSSKAGFFIPPPISKRDFKPKYSASSFLGQSLGGDPCMAKTKTVFIKIFFRYYWF